MRIALDARTLLHAESGIGNYTVNLVRALLAADPDLELLLICRTTPAQEDLQDSRITVMASRKNTRNFWRQPCHGSVSAQAPLIYSYL
jgi:hypothetical protein